MNVIKRQRSDPFSVTLARKSARHRERSDISNLSPTSGLRQVSQLRDILHLRKIGKLRKVYHPIRDREAWPANPKMGSRTIAGRLPELRDEDWVLFRADPPRYLINLADLVQADAILREVEKRQSTQPARD